jgi:response regulator RpfG family c-di-GMP phosphodiesterase
MQKVLFSKDLISIVMRGENLLNRTDIMVFTAATTDDILKIHIEETLSLIVTKLDLPGTRSEAIFDIIWQSQYLKEVLVIMICEDNILHRTRCKRCGAHYVLSMPVDPGLVQEKVRQFLNVAQRQAYRVILKVSVEGKFNDQPFLCLTENISATGALIKAEMDLSPGNCISCSFYLPDGTKINTQSEVVRVLKQAGSNETLYGIRYVNIPEESKAKIEAYVKKDRL